MEDSAIVILLFPYYNSATKCYCTGAYSENFSLIENYKLIENGHS